jgi:beta-lactamase class A
VNRVPSRRVAVALTVLAGAAAVVAGTLLLVGRHDPGAHAAAAYAARQRGARVPRVRPRTRPLATAAPGPRPRPDPLSTRAGSFLATRGGTVLAAVYDLDTGQTWTTGQGPPQAEASVVKLNILEALLARRGPAGLSPRQRSLARLMIEQSDNDAATDLWHAVGGPRGVRSFNAAAGLTHTVPSRCVVCAGFPWPGWGLTTTTPADQISLLRQVAEPGPLLSGAARGFAFQLMKDVMPGQRWGISGGVSPRATVALKDGWLPLDQAGTDWQVNSVGWVRGLGRDYLIAVLSTGNPTEDYGIETVDGLSAIVWQGLG